MKKKRKQKIIKRIIFEKKRIKNIYKHKTDDRDKAKERWGDNEVKVKRKIKKNNKRIRNKKKSW